MLTNIEINNQNDYEKISLNNDNVVEVTSTASEISSGYKSNNQKDLMRLIRSTVDKN